MQLIISLHENNPILATILPNLSPLIGRLIPLPGDKLVFFVRASNFGAEAERSYIFSRSEAENVLNMFLNLHGILCTI